MGTWLGSDDVGAVGFEIFVFTVKMDLKLNEITCW
jgi:hypothetical protein